MMHGGEPPASIHYISMASISISICKQKIAPAVGHTVLNRKLRWFFKATKPTAPRHCPGAFQVKPCTRKDTKRREAK